MSDKNEKKAPPVNEPKAEEPKPQTEFDTNPILTPFRDDIELDSVALREGVVLQGGMLKRATGLASAPNQRLFLRKLAGIPVVTAVDPQANQGLPANIPLGNVTSFSTKTERAERDSRVALSQERLRAEHERAREERRQALVAQHEQRMQELERGGVT